MQLEHTFTVPVTIDEAWTVLTDIERVAPCMPGAALDTVDGDDFTGTVKVKLGPISLTYKGKASFVEKDAAGHRAVINAQGRDARGNGTASAKVTATLSGNGGSTKVDVITDLDITGKPAQFGRGVMVDVGNKLLGQFADCLASTLQGGTPASEPAAKAGATATGDGAPTAPAKRAPRKPAPPAGATADETPQPAAAQTPEEPVMQAPPRPQPVRRHADDIEPIDLIHSAGPAVAKRLAPVLAVLALLFVLRGRRRRRRARR